MAGDASTGVTSRLQVDIMSTSKPEPGPGPHTYRCDADVVVSEPGYRQVCRARITVHHPSGWMGVAAGFEYDLDHRVYPTFESRAEQACLWALEAFRSDEIISVLLLGTGAVHYAG